MALKSLSLFNFRNYSKVSFQFSSSLNLIVGPNAVGKTNLLEAVYLLATGNSFRALKNEQMINWNQQLAIAEAKVGERELKISLQKENQRTKKEFWVDKIKKTRRQFLDSFSAVIFRPEEIRVITSSPSRRRDFLNDILLPLDWQYRQAVLAYEKALRRRNRVLLEISEGKAGQQELFYWNQALAKNGEIIYQGRKKFVDFVNQFFNISQEKRFNHLSCQYLVNPISLTILDQNLTEDLKQGVTTAGPHRDDFSLLNSYSCLLSQTGIRSSSDLNAFFF